MAVFNPEAAPKPKQTERKPWAANTDRDRVPVHAKKYSPYPSKQTQTQLQIPIEKGAEAIVMIKDKSEQQQLNECAIFQT